MDDTLVNNDHNQLVWRVRLGDDEEGKLDSLVDRIEKLRSLVNKEETENKKKRIKSKSNQRSKIYEDRIISYPPLPEEIMRMIFSFSDKYELIRMRKVSIYFDMLCMEEFLKRLSLTIALRYDDDSRFGALNGLKIRLDFPREYSESIIFETKSKHEKFDFDRPPNTISLTSVNERERCTCCRLRMKYGMNNISFVNFMGGYEIDLYIAPIDNNIQQHVGFCEDICKHHMEDEDNNSSHGNNDRKIAQGNVRIIYVRVVMDRKRMFTEFMDRRKTFTHVTI